MPVTPGDVSAIIDTERDVTPFLETANVVVGSILASSGLAQNVLDQITKYIAAHFVWLTESNSLVQKEVGGTREVYRTFSDKSTGFQTSRFGQMALTLDTTGTLAAKTANNGMKALFSVIPQHGNPPAWWPGWTEWPVW
jgi:hypothetical protein